VKNFNFKALIPHLVAIGIFLAVAIIYCHPAIQGKVLEQSDNVQWKAAAHSSFEYKEKNGHFPLWNTHLFSGMPLFLPAMLCAWDKNGYRRFGKPWICLCHI